MWRLSFVARRPTFRTFSQAKYPAYRSSRTLPLVAGNLFAASGSISGWKPTNHNGRIRGMPEFIADGAGKKKRNASKAVPAGLFETSQTERKNLLVCPVAGIWRAQIERAGAVFQSQPGRSRNHACRDPATHQPGRWQTAVASLHLRGLRRFRLPPRLQGQMEGFYCHE